MSVAKIAEEYLEPDIQPMLARRRNIWFGFLLSLMLVGGIAIFIRISEGLASTNLTSTTPWGTWVAFYIFFVGLSAGAFLLSTLIYVFGMQQFERVGKIALFTAIICMVVALNFVLLDLGRMDRFWHPLAYWNLTSVLAWEVHFYILYITLLGVELYFALRQDLIRLSRRGNSFKHKLAKVLTLGSTDLSQESKENDHRWMKILGIIGIPLAIFGVHGGTGTLFAVVKARPMWNSALFPVVFVVSALVSGTALLAAVYSIQNRARNIPVDKETLKALARMMILFLFIDLGLQVYEFLIAAYSLEPEETHTLSTMFTSSFSWSFWGVQIFLGAVVPIYLVLNKRTGESLLGLTAACVLVVLGIIGVRFNIVLPPLIVPVLEGLPTGNYYPTLVEIGSSLGVIALGLLLYTVGMKLLPLEEGIKGVRTHD
ncbi:MAG: NrfD/PsrC family molybdoenzyme membrane anchor subunit [Desulfitobacteriaceae bacterium]